MKYDNKYENKETFPYDKSEKGARFNKTPPVANNND